MVAYVAGVFLNGLCAGALLIYTLSHVLHLSISQTHFIVSSLVAMFRGFASSFGSAIGGGIFSRVLKRRLEAGFARYGHGNEVGLLIRRLLGSPALVARLTGIEKEVAIEAYGHATRTLFRAAFALALVTAVVQAGTGWTAQHDTRMKTAENNTERQARDR